VVNHKLRGLDGATEARRGCQYQQERWLGSQSQDAGCELVLERAAEDPSVSAGPQSPAVSTCHQALCVVQFDPYRSPVTELQVPLAYAGSGWRLFAGAGIIEGSVPALEWDETAIKFEPMLRALEASGMRLGRIETEGHVTLFENHGATQHMPND